MVNKWSGTRVSTKTAVPVPSYLLKSRVSTVKKITTTGVTMTLKAWPLKLSHKPSVTRFVAVLKTTKSSTDKVSLTTRSTGLKAVSSLATSTTVSPLTAVGRILPPTLVELILVPPKLSPASQPASS